MITKILLRITVVIFIFTINICSAYRHDEVPELLNTDLRLAAMGNLDLVVIGWDNEINAYDFGESPAGVIEDNNGKSTVYVPSIYGFTQFDNLPSHAWDGYGVSILGVTKVKSMYAVGGFLSKTRTANTLEYPWYEWHAEYYDTYRGGFIAAYKFSPRSTMGLRFSYTKMREHVEYRPEAGPTYDDYLDDHLYEYEPSILIRHAKLNWQIGLNYHLSKYKLVPNIHEFTFPMLFSSPNFSFGFKVKLVTDPSDGKLKKSLETRALHQIFMNKHNVNIGYSLKITNPIIYDDLSEYWLSGWQMNVGTGIAYHNAGFGLIGMQYVRHIRWLEDHWSGSEIEYEHYVYLGTEFLLIKNLPTRIGYVNVNYDYPDNYYNDPAYDIITAGFGVRIPKAKLEIDFAYNLKFIDRAEHYLYWHTFIDIDHIFGLSGRFIF